ncbi:MAG: MotA/TolQ/ExbB proton channel family protein [Anaerovibrio sp.]|uniref:MotA/TolQ/ExbB proton channel family protein n=1 Tax=Anaerovibrio sp. TaxID=1872532 RepID=UPI0025EF519D|nr:MotA/TolQ/ExbB proton channel family protein [Anaerovibrio sp.]MCR5176588.1 MotA/TolQ/ExbB proton channel family protein [Anaerovibrio sp.]
METIMSGIDFFQKGGPVMYVLLLCSVFVVSIAIERWMYFGTADAGRNFAIRFAELMSNGETGEAADFAGKTKGALPSLLAKGMSFSGDESVSLTTFFEVQSGIALTRFRKRLYYLNVIVTMAPLLGLLGTISGMISAFSIFNLESGQAMAITGGVGEALIATAMGLCTAIIALAVHAYFTQRIDSIVSDMEQCFSLAEGMAEERE